MAAKRNSIGSSTGLFSPTVTTRHGRHHHHHLPASSRRRSFTLANGTTSSGSSSASASSAPWSHHEHALLVRAWRDVAEHPASAVESVDAFQTRLFLRFQELSGVGSDADNDDTVSMAGSECSMESVDVDGSSSSGGSGGSTFSPRARTQTSVVLKTYALRRMAGFINTFVTKQDALRQRLAAQQQESDGTMEMDESQESQESTFDAADAAAPVDWFTLSKNDQIERFQAAGATNYIELDEHMYQTILTTLELQDKCKQDKPGASRAAVAASSTATTTSGSGGAAAPWSDDEVRCVLAAWRDSHLRTPTKVPGADTFYARFLALNGESSQRSKPEVADVKIALLHMHSVIAAFNNRTPTHGKLTRGRVKRQRQNWFALSDDARRAAFAASGGSQGCGFVNVSEDMYATIGELTGTPSPRVSLDAVAAAVSAGELTPEPRKRRSLSGSRSHSSSLSSLSSGSSGSDAPPPPPTSSTTIDLISDDGDTTENTTERTHSGSTAATYDSGDVDMDEQVDASIEFEEPQCSSSSSSHDDTVADDDGCDRSNQSADEHMETTAVVASKVVDGDGANVDTDASSPGRPRQSSLKKKQKLEHAPEVVSLLEKQAQDLSALVLQMQEERERERLEREQLLSAIKVDQQGRESVIELLCLEQEERRRDREERRKMLQLLLREQQARQLCGSTSGTVSSSGSSSEDTKMGVKDEP